MPPIFRDIAHFFAPLQALLRWVNHYVPSSWLIVGGALLILFFLSKVLEKQAKFDGLTLLSVLAIGFALAWYFGWFRL